MKKLIASLLVIAMALSLTACATVEQDDKATSSEAASESTWNVTRPEGLPADFPNKEITYIYPFGVGSMQDVYFRILAEEIKENEGWKFSMVVKQEEGASGDIGWTKFMQSAPDGYTIGFAPTAQQITAVSLGKEYVASNLAYIFNMMSDPGAVGVSSKSEYATMQDLINAAKEKPETITIGVTSVSGSEGLAVIQLENASGAKFKVVPFDGETEVLTAVAGGHCDAYCLNVGDLSTFLTEGTIKILAVGSETRSDLEPDVPTYKECGYDVIQVNSRAIAAPAGTSEAIIEYLSACFMAAAASPEVQEQCKEMTIPYDAKDYKDTTAMFDGYFETYQQLWQTEPWA